MKIGDLLYDKWNGNIGIITHTDNDLEFDIYWINSGIYWKEIYYGQIMEIWREAQKLKSR